MQSFQLDTFLARSTDKPFEETTLSKVLAALPSVAEGGPWIAGGALRRTLNGQEPESDFDFFFRDETQLADFKAALETRGFVVVKETDHHIELDGPADGKTVKVQLIRFAFYQSAAAVIDSFDFTICQFSFDGKTLTCGDHSLWDLGRKRLAVNKITFPLSTMRRVLKYANQGFIACSGCLTTILTSVADNPQLRDNLSIQYVD